ncbi:hypothetical protein CANCADRAFT_24618 [Tortispora caseinolytica NRRL Y-17796]|uniref:Letm1 RBD domain-containing protein n=1 Tax=Tortispora caseinolytica NRRL Y-17796 TaxID=767744 RepID=A0A1E4TH95_9ASCO|nr:hypothetical protein CANCADRAFT_24618 [Tortispora caseinolytica NRRL Y-17796]
MPLSAVQKKEDADAPKPTMWQKVKHALSHYWDGTKLLGTEIKISVRLAVKMASGYELSRREQRQLTRTTQDMVRLVPFSVFLIVPFAELLLPVALKLFPNLLPSTYEAQSERDKKVGNLRKVRVDVSSFLRKTIEETGLVSVPTMTEVQQEKFREFFQKIRSEGSDPTPEELITVCRIFKDDLILDNLSRPQLVAMARYMNLSAFGTDLILRYNIRYKLRQTKQDDRQILYEGVDSLSVAELQQVCMSRGIQTFGVSPGKLRDDLSTWLRLRLVERVPATLLVLSSAYLYSNAVIPTDGDSAKSYYDALTAVLSSIPDEVFHETDLEVSSATGSATNKQRLEVLKEQEELIKEENQQEKESGHVINVKDDASADDEEVAAVATSAKGEEEGPKKAEEPVKDRKGDETKV